MVYRFCVFRRHEFVRGDCGVRPERGGFRLPDVQKSGREVRDVRRGRRGSARASRSTLHRPDGDKGLELFIVFQLLQAAQSGRYDGQIVLFLNVLRECHGEKNIYIL